jgi:Tripartite tricarboxylate transporter TctB family
MICDNGRPAAARGGLAISSDGTRGLGLRIRFQNDFWCGLLFVAIGVAVMVLARNYRLGTAARMGPGYFPTLLGGLLALLGLTLIIPSLFKAGEKFPALHPRPLILILCSIVVFGVTLDVLGFALAVFALVIVGGLADPELRPLEIAGVALFLVAFSLTIFVALLGMPLTVWPNLWPSLWPSL